jgi:pimeloyl-ACP methyl ester carboxylesterase
MAQIVLVHGAWHGGWCWRDVARELRGWGHEVHTPTMTGVGERSHLLSPQTGLKTHIEDICAVLAFEDLKDIVLCGHSYGGMVITGVADRMAERVRSIVYLDAFVPENGKSAFDLLDPARVPAIRAGAVEQNGVWTLKPTSAAFFGVRDPARREWVDRTCRNHPMLAFEERIELTGNWRAVPRKTYILAAAYNPSSFQRYRALAEDPSWTFLEADCGHEVMVDLPEWLAARLHEAAS